MPPTRECHQCDGLIEPLVIGVVAADRGQRRAQLTLVGGTELVGSTGGLGAQGGEGTAGRQVVAMCRGEDSAWPGWSGGPARTRRVAA